MASSFFAYSTFGSGTFTAKDNPSSGQATQVSITYGELFSMPRTTEYAELNCYGLPVDHGNWTGVRLIFILEKAAISQQAGAIKFYASDGYSTALDISIAMREDVIIAYEKDGNPLPEKTRLVIPSANGADWISMITEIEVLSPSGVMTTQINIL